MFMLYVYAFKIPPDVMIHQNCLTEERFPLTKLENSTINLIA